MKHFLVLTRHPQVTKQPALQRREQCVTMAREQGYKPFRHQGGKFRRHDSLPRRNGRRETYETRDNGFLHTFRISIVFVFQIYYSEVFG